MDLLESYRVYGRESKKAAGGGILFSTELS